MRKKRRSVLVMPGDELTGGLPYITEPDDMDEWPSPAAAKQALEAIHTISNQRFSGVQVTQYDLDKDRFLCSLLIDYESPEGKLAFWLITFAKTGRSLPVDECLSILRRIYREQGLVVPVSNEPPR